MVHTQPKVCSLAVLSFLPPLSYDQVSSQLILRQKLQLLILNNTKLLQIFQHLDNLSIPSHGKLLHVCKLMMLTPYIFSATTLPPITNDVKRCFWSKIPGIGKGNNTLRQQSIFQIEHYDFFSVISKDPKEFRKWTRLHLHQFHNVFDMIQSGLENGRGGYRK